MTKDNEEDELNLQQLQKNTKLKIFQLTKCYLQHCSSINPIFIYLIILIQSLQILWFSIHPQLTFLGSPLLLTYIRSALAYVNFQNFIQNNNNLLFPFVLLSSTITLLHILTLTLSIHKIPPKPTTQKDEFTNIINKITAYQIVLINSILFVPIYNVSIITLYCEENSYYYRNGDGTCYDTLHIVLCILSAGNLVVLVVGSLGYWFVFYLRNPFSKSYYAVANNLFRLGKLLLKILFPLYFLIDQKSTLQNVYVIVQLILVFVYIAFFRINSIHNFYPNFFYCQLFLQSLILWFCINTAISYQIPNSGMSFNQSCICSVIFAYCVCTIQAAITRRFLDNNISGNIKKQDREKFVYLLIHVLFKEVSENQVSPFVYIKLLNSNTNICSLKVSKYLKKSDLKTQQLTQVTRDLLLTLLAKFFQDTPSTNLKLVKSLILFDSGRKILSLHQISELRTDKLSIYEQFIIYYFKSTRNIYQQSEIKNNDDNISEINTYLQFTELMNQFENQLEFCAKNNQQFWEELCEDLPSMNKIFNLAENTIKYANKVEEIYKKIQSIFPENLASLYLYYQFLNHVCAKNKEHHKIKEKWFIERQRELKKQNIEIEDKSTKIKFKANSKMCVLQVSTNSATIGTITNCNSEVKNYLGYQKSELFNQKVTKIMPKIYSEIHDKFIKDYLEKVDEMKLPVEKTVFAFKKNLKMIETCLAVKIFPNIICGFQMVGFFRQMNSYQDQMNIMVNMKTLQIEGMTQGFLNLTDNRIKLQQIQKQPLKLSHLFPQIQPNYVFKIGEQIQTLFRFSDCTDKLIELDEISYQTRKKYDKNIMLVMESINYYPNAEIGVFSVQAVENLVSLHDTSQKHEKKISRLGTNSFVARDNRRKNTMLEENQREQVSLQRKMEDFMNSNSHLFQIFMLKILFFVCFISLTIVSIFINIYENDSSIQHRAILWQLQLSNNISILQGKILTQNKLIISQSSDPVQWSKCKTQYLDYLKGIQQTTTELFQRSNDQLRSAQNLIINQQQIYEFDLMPKNGVPQKQHFHFYDGISQIAFIGVDFLDNKITEFQNFINQQMKSAYYLIQQNMKTMLPSISESITQAYSRYFQKFISQEMASLIYFVCGKTTTFILVYFVMCFAISKFIRFNYIFVEIYNSILKWDAYQLYYKCNKFRNKGFDGGVDSQTSIQTQGKKQDMWKVFPRSLIIKLSQGFLKPPQKPQPKKSGFAQSQQISNSNYNSTYNPNDQQQKLRESTKDRQKRVSEIVESKFDLINLKSDITFKKKFITIFLLLLALTLINYSALFFKGYYNSKLDQQRENSVNLGAYSKAFLYTMFYGTQLIDGDKSYQSLYDNQLNKFYDISTNVSKLIGDPNPHLRQIYRQIELINSLVHNELPNLSNQTKSTLLLESQHKLFNLSDEVNKFSREHEKTTMDDIENLEKMIKITKIVLDVVITVVFCRLAQVYLLEAVEKQLMHSCNMLRMLPVWLIAKNRKIKDIIIVKPKLENQKQHSKIMAEDSAVNLMQISKVDSVKQ